MIRRDGQMRSITGVIRGHYMLLKIDLDNPRDIFNDIIQRYRSCKCRHFLPTGIDWLPHFFDRESRSAHSV